MTITLDKIDTIMERAEVSYEEAKEALERNEGDLVAALIDLEQNAKIKKGKKKVRENINEKGCSFFSKIGKEIKRLHTYKFRITKEEEQVLSIPLTIAILLALFTLPVSLFVLGALMLLGYKLSIKTKDSEVSVKDIVE